MNIREVYEKYKHLDHLFSDEEWLPENPIGQAAFDFWQAIKQEVEEQEWGNLKVKVGRREQPIRLTLKGQPCNEYEGGAQC